MAQDTYAVEIAALRKQDRKLARIMDVVGPCGLKVRKTGSHFEALCSSITYQQVSGKAAATIFGRVKALGKKGFPTAQEIMELPDETLRAAGLSRQKMAAIRDLASRVVEGSLALHRLGHLPDEDVITHLTQVRGIGRWTAEMTLLFRLGRPDVLAVTDLGIQKGVMRVDGLKEMPSPKAVAARSEAWAPHRSVASWYLWRASELP